MERKFRGAQFVGARKRINENRNNSVRRNRRIYENETTTDEQLEMYRNKLDLLTDELLTLVKNNITPEIKSIDLFPIASKFAKFELRVSINPGKHFYSSELTYYAENGVVSSRIQTTSYGAVNTDGSGSNGEAIYSMRAAFGLIDHFLLSKKMESIVLELQELAIEIGLQRP